VTVDTDPSTSPAAHTVTDPEALRAVRARLRRAQGQLGGILTMIDDGQSCEDVVTQLAAASKAIDRAAFLLIATGLRECLTDGDENADAVAEKLQKLFLTMA
jgi:CsoR family transcriptional regulator, copper-sensing transcriptional repressor